MKKWTTPEVTELNITATANGCLPFLFESCITNDAIADAIQGALQGNQESGKGGDTAVTPDTLS